MTTLPALNRDPSMTLVAFFETVFLPWHPDATATTAEQYRISLRHLTRFAGNVRLMDLTDDLLCNLTIHLGEAREGKAESGQRLQPMARATINKTLRLVVAIWNYAVRRKFLDSSARPDVQFLKLPKRNPEAWDLDEMGRILDACSQANGFVGAEGQAVPASLFWQAYVLLTFETALRRAAALSIRIEDLDLARLTVRVRAEQQKQLADQVFQVREETADLLQHLVDAAPGRDLLFPWQFGIKHPFTRAYRRILAAAGLPSTRRDLVHKIRRTTATMVANVAGEQYVQHLLGHSTPALTKNYVDRTKLTHTQRAAEMMPEPPRGRLAKAEAIDPRAEIEAVLAEEILSPESVRRAVQALRAHHKRHYGREYFQRDFAAELGVSEGYLTMSLRGQRSRSARLRGDKQYYLTSALEAKIRAYLRDWLGAARQEGGAA